MPLIVPTVRGLLIRAALFWFCATGLGGGSLQAAGPVVISEFMASNARTIADETKSFEDWIEVRNESGAAVNMNGWALTTSLKKPRQWLFPATNLAAGAHLVVWASGKDRAQPGAALHTNFKLSIGGEYLALTRPDGSIASEFRPSYPAQLADVSYGFVAGHGEPVFFSQPTPGKPNESQAQSLGPVITMVTNRPALPKPRDVLVISARIQPLLGPVTNVTLHWSVMFENETSAPMTKSGGDVWSAAIAANARKHGEMVRWYITATDDAGRGSEHPPSRKSKNASRQLGVVYVDSQSTEPLPVFQLFIPPRQMAGADSEAGARGCFAYDGEFYDNVLVKLRGNTTAGFPKKSHRLEFPNDHGLRHPGGGPRVRDTSLMAEWGDPTYLRQHLSFWMQAEAGSAAPFHYPVRVDLNGQFWQLAMHSEVLGEELLERHGLDPDGALYKAVGTVTPDFNSTGGFEKKTRRKEGDDDYRALAKALHEQQPAASRRQAVFNLMNVPATINYMAVARLCQEDDDIWANMSLYHDCDGTAEWRPIPFDMNVSWGLSFGRGGVDAAGDNFRSHPFFGASHVGEHQGFNRLYDAVVAGAETRQMLLRRMRTILDHWWQPPGTVWTNRIIEQHIAQMTNLIWATAVLDRQKWGNSWNAPGNVRPEKALSAGVEELVKQFIEPRRHHFFVTHSISNQSPPVGITSRHRAGIPAPQSADVKLAIFAVNLMPGNAVTASVCLTNTESVAVDVSGWRLGGAVRFTFPPGTVVPAGGKLYVAANVRAFREQSAPNKDEPYRFVIGNFKAEKRAGSAVTLLNERGTEVARK